MKTMRRSLPLLALGLALALCLTACGGNDSAGLVGGSSGSAVYTTPEQEATGALSDYDGGMEPAAEEGSPDTAPITPQNENRKLITTVDIEAESRDYDSFLSWLDGKLAQAGGYIENSEMQAYDENHRNCHLTLRIPADKLDGFLSSMGENCNVLNKSIRQEDVTLSYVDTQSHRDALRVEQERLLELLEQAESLEDIIALEDRLTNVRYQLQNYGSALRMLDSQVDYSTVELSLQEVRELTEPAPESWGSRAWSGMKENARDIGQFFQELGLFLVTHLPILTLLGLVALVVWLATIKPRRRAREHRRQQQELIRSAGQANPEQEKKE